MEDLVPLASAGPVDRAHDALTAEDVQHRLDIGLSDGRVLREVARAVAIFDPEGVTRWSNIVAATSCSPG